ncbi:maleylpyruvate isomerase family mycothiol-dependent enzyme [Granulicoccus sp. GXG6511]|uniref:maleylpyruvate isomerase family mycothiol-dependent enzyme n=1 Tax=Granulicoccus sp. GXG6511 TaxID=3381351 RepID=UPI003D7D1154
MPDLAESLQWVRLGVDLFAKALAAQDDDRLAQESSLPGWTEADLVAHVVERVGTYAAALGATVPAAASTTAPTELRESYRKTALALREVLGERPKRADWTDTVTVDGAEQTSGDLPWLLARELLIHATDLGDEVYFTDLPPGFLAALIDDMVRHRTNDGTPALEVLSQDTGEAWRLDGPGEPLRVMARAADMAAWLAGREGAKVKVLGPGELPVLTRWL